MEAYPLQWPVGYPRTEKPERSRFGNHSLSKATNWVINEIQALGGRNIIISTNIPIRKDGLPRSDYLKRSITDYGVAVYFMYKGEQKVLCCDAWDCIEDNIWAIVKSAEAMRGLDRWKVSQILEQAFTGFKALPEGSLFPTTTCWQILQMEPTKKEDEINAQYKKLAKEMHPDTGGSAEKFADLHNARDMAITYARNKQFT